MALRSTQHRVSIVYRLSSGFTNPIELEEMKREQEEYELALQVSLAEQENMNQYQNEEEEMIKKGKEMKGKENFFTSSKEILHHHCNKLALIHCEN